jgi:hypothetical protein
MGCNKLFKVTPLILLLIGVLNFSLLAQKRPTVGAIRWDAWIGNIHPVGLAVERNLSPHQYHYRSPFYSKEISWDSIQCRGANLSIIQKENKYAQYCGINYWAFCWYPRNSGLDTAMQLYLQCTHKYGIDWCCILGTAKFDERTDGVWLVKQFKKQIYQKVLGRRPLLYVLGEGISQRTINYLQQINKAEGNDSIYVVAMGEDKNTVDKYADTINADAISAYTTWAYNNGGAYYPLVPTMDSVRWEEHRATGRQVVPWVTTGRNAKPRIDHPVWWTKVGEKEWTEDATPRQIANHVNDCLDWIKKHPSSTLARTLLIYAWNEFDEGGYICPTLNNNTERIRAIHNVLVH